MNTSDFAKEIRKMALTSIFKAQCGHPGSSLSSADIIAVLYNEVMNIYPESPQNPLRDRFVLSKGHACPALYSALAIKGFFGKEKISSLRKIDSFLEGMPDMRSTPGIDMSSGSLGQGISAAAGMALAAVLKKQNYNVYSILGDGELNEGQVWEAFLFSSHYKLSNLCVFIDKNGLQLSGSTNDVLSTEHLKDKLLSFGLKVMVIDGHNPDEIRGAVSFFLNKTSAPTAIIANTIKGKGVSFMENQAEWHGRAPNREEYEKAVKEVYGNG